MADRARLEQGPEARPRNLLADYAREYGLHSLSNRLNDPTSGIGLITDAVGSVAMPAYNALMSPYRALTGEMGDYETNKDAYIQAGMDVAGTAMTGGLAAPRQKVVSPAAPAALHSNPLISDALAKAQARNAAINDLIEQSTTGPKTLQGFSGSETNQHFTGGFTRGPWASPSTDVANTYASTANGRRGNIAPMEFRFKNPVTIDAADNLWRNVPVADGVKATTNELSNYAMNAGHDGIVFKNVRDNLSFGGEPSDVYHALQRGTVYSPLTGDLLYANGGRQGAATGAAVNALADQPKDVRPVRAYRGSNNEFNIKDFDPNASNPSWRTNEGALFFGSKDTANIYGQPELAFDQRLYSEIVNKHTSPQGKMNLQAINDEYAARAQQVGSPTVTPADIDTSNFGTSNLRGYRWESDEGARLKSQIDKAKEQGKSGLVINGMMDASGYPDTQYAVWGRGTVRSPLTGDLLYANGGRQGAVAGAAVNGSIGMSGRPQANALAAERSLDALGYYSQALEAARSLKQAKGTPEQMFAQLKAAGVKDAEIEATGLRGFLDGKRSVTRDEIAGHLEANRVGLNERTYDRSPPDERELANLRRNNGTPDDILAAELGLGDDPLAPLDRTKWSNYSLDPSNPTYRETVLHLPSFETPIREARKPMQVEFNALQERYSGRGNPLADAEVARMEQLREKLNDNVRKSKEARTADFRQHHFENEPNVIGHMMTSMTKHEGRPVYTIDQIQSDWGQKLRDGGVRDEAKIAELKRRMSEMTSKAGEMNPVEQSALDRSGWNHAEAIEALQNALPRTQNPLVAPALEALKKRDTAALSEIARLQAELRTAEAATPGNPLVNTTDQWVNTTLRRALRQAADSEADYVAIPSGKTVLSYNPGDERGMQAFYDQIVPKNLGNILGKYGKPQRQYVETLDTPSRGAAGQGFSLFQLTPDARDQIKQGMPLFANGRPGAATGAAVNANNNDDGLNAILNKYGLSDLLRPSGDWTTKVRPGDA